MSYKVISNSRAILGEGISIRPDKSVISWVDITSNKVHWKNLKTEKEGSLLQVLFFQVAHSVIKILEFTSLTQVGLTG